MNNLVEQLSVARNEIKNLRYNKIFSTSKAIDLSSDLLLMTMYSLENKSVPSLLCIGQT